MQSIVFRAFDYVIIYIKWTIYVNYMELEDKLNDFGCQFTDITLI